VELGDRLGAREGRAEVGLPVAPALPPTGAEKNDRALWQRPMLLLPGLEVLDLDPVVAVARALLGDVHHHPEADELLDGDLVGGAASLEEVNGGVYVCSSVLGGAELISGVEVALAGAQAALASLQTLPATSRMTTSSRRASLRTAAGTGPV
jgi:hypothetical protein